MITYFLRTKQEKEKSKMQKKLEKVQRRIRRGSFKIVLKIDSSSPKKRLILCL